MQDTSLIQWNPNVKLIISDVDETLADLYMAAEPEMITELIQLLEEGKALFFVTGQGLKSVQWRIVDKIPEALRSKIVVGHCSGAEVWGYEANGQLRVQPFYSVYEDAMNEEQKKKWRELVQQVVTEFKLITHDPMPVMEFKKQFGDDPLHVMLEDRGPQITFEVVNGYEMSAEQAAQLELQIPETHGSYDLRTPIVERIEELFLAAQLPISPRMAGNFAIDLAVKGISKTTAVKNVLHDPNVLSTIGLTQADLEHPETMEVWGDKFSVVRGGTDRHMSEALPKEVRSIDFREEDPAEFLEGYNIVIWNGEKHLHEGTLEYLQKRANS